MTTIADVNVWVGQTYTQTVYGSLTDIQKLQIVVLTVGFHENSLRNIVWSRFPKWADYIIVVTSPVK